MIAVYVVLCLLVIAVCVLFAMFGELAAQGGAVNTPSGRMRPSESAPQADPILDANIGRTLSGMPTEILARPAKFNDASPRSGDQATTTGVIVLSTICRSCTQFAQEWASSSHAAKLPTPITAVITARDAHDAEQFVSQTHLLKITNVTFAFDKLGDWCRSELHVNTSPALVIVTDGVLSSAWRISSFTEIPTLWNKQSPAQLSKDKDQAGQSRIKEPMP